MQMVLSLDELLLLTKQLRDIVAALRQPHLASNDWHQLQQRVELEKKLGGTTHISERANFNAKISACNRPHTWGAGQMDDHQREALVKRHAEILSQLPPVAPDVSEAQQIARWQKLLLEKLEIEAKLRPHVNPL